MCMGGPSAPPAPPPPAPPPEPAKAPIEQIVNRNAQIQKRMAAAGLGGTRLTGPLGLTGQPDMPGTKSMLGA